MDRIVMFSGGTGSWAAAMRVAAISEPSDSLILLFTDTLVEDPDLYRFLGQAAWAVFCATTTGVLVDLVWLVEGRDIWEVFRDERFLGNSRVDPCSKILKRQMADRWMEENCDPESTIVYVGIDWTEINRFTRLSERRRPWKYEAPLCSAPYISKADMLRDLEREGIKPPRLYSLGFSHNNCGGGCIKAGIGHFSLLHRVLPDVFAQWEKNEEGIRRHLGRRDIAILRDRRGGESKPLTLTELRGRLEAGASVDQFDLGGCGCFVDDDHETAETTSPSTTSSSK